MEEMGIITTGKIFLIKSNLIGIPLYKMNRFKVLKLLLKIFSKTGMEIITKLDNRWLQLVKAKYLKDNNHNFLQRNKTNLANAWKQQIIEIFLGNAIYGFQKMEIT